MVTRLSLRISVYTNILADIRKDEARNVRSGLLCFVRIFDRLFGLSWYVFCLSNNRNKPLFSEYVLGLDEPHIFIKKEAGDSSDLGVLENVNVSPLPVPVPAAEAKTVSSGTSKKPSGKFPCNHCGKVFNLKPSLQQHRSRECGKEPRFWCPFCSYRAKRRTHLNRHIDSLHPEME